MKTVILAGGRGTRLIGEAHELPKPLMPIGEHPILWHIMKLYAHYGHKDFILCLGYLGDQIREYFFNYELHNCDLTVTLGPERRLEYHGRPAEDWRVTLADTGRDTLKGARLKLVERYLDEETFFLTYGDGVANIDLDALLAFHRAHGRLATVTGVRPPSRFGELLVDGERVRQFTEKPQVAGGLINGGFFALNRGIFDYLTTDGTCDLEMGALERVAEDGQLMVYLHEGEWACLDTPRDRSHLNALWRRDDCFWRIWE